ncbi:nuclease-related domain-containing protein [Terrabacter sp. MAHUQ-38]|uniref:nuclease-related domain-containing protein n=1 Tax=unclassified Terrabacter TaxID=2630222 RepID=UPI00351C5C31
MAEGGSARARAEQLWGRAAVEREKQEAARELAESLEAQARAWDAGAEGERRVAAALAHLPDGWVVLHDRLLRPGRSGVNLDHVVVGPAGIFLVDAKNWAGGTTVHDGNLWQHAGRSAPKGAELDRLNRFAGEMEKSLGVPVVPVVALAGGHGSRFRPQRVRGVDIVPCARLAKWLRGQPAGADTISVDLLARRVAHTYPPASAEETMSATAAAATRPLTVNDVVRSSRPGGSRSTTRTPTARRRTRSGRRKRSAAPALVGVLGLMALVYVGPHVIPHLLQSVVPGPAISSSGSTPETGARAPGNGCHALTKVTIQRVTGSRTVLERPLSGDDVCTWWLTKPRYASDRADVTLTTGLTVRTRFAAGGTTGSRIDMLPGEVSAWLPEDTTLSGWKSRTRVSQPFIISLRFTYPQGASAKQARTTEAAAEKTVTRLAEELARDMSARSAPKALLRGAASADDHHGAVRVMDDAVAHRAEQHAGEAAVSA